MDPGDDGDNVTIQHHEINSCQNAQQFVKTSILEKRDIFVTNGLLSFFPLNKPSHS